jgi:hypothetical protein
MTTKQTASATKDATPKDGEQLLYIDWQGNRLYGPGPVKTKKGQEAKDV